MSKVIEIKVILKTKCQKKKFSFKAKKNQQPKNEKKETHCDFKTKLLQRLTSRSNSIMNNLHKYMYACTQVM